MNDLRTAAQMALEALRHGITKMNHAGFAVECMPLHYAADALRAALAAEPQPVAWVSQAFLDEVSRDGGAMFVTLLRNDEGGMTPLYTAAPTALPLTEFEFSVDERDGEDWICVAGGVCVDREDADREAAHYAAQYAQDGDVRVTVFQRVILSRNEIGGTHG